MEKAKSSYPINLNLTIEPASLKKIVESGRLMEFVDALSTLAAAHIRAELVAHVAKGSTAGVTISKGFEDDEKYGTPPRPWPWPRGVWEDALREVAVRDVTKRFSS